MLTTQSDLSDPKWDKYQITIENTSPDPLTLFKLRYHFWSEAPVEGQVWNPYGIPASVVHNENGLGFVEFDLGGQSLAPGQAYQWGSGVQGGLHRVDWGNWIVQQPGYATLHDALGQIIAGPSSSSALSSSSYSSSSSAYTEVLEVLVVQESTEASWSKPRIRIRNISSLPITLGDLIFSVTATEGLQALVQVFDPHGLSSVITHKQATSWYVRVTLNTTLAPGQRLNWGNGVSFGVHHDNWSPWNSDDDLGLIAILDLNGNPLLGSYVSLSSSSIALPSSSSIFVSSSSIALPSSSSIFVSSSSIAVLSSSSIFVSSSSIALPSSSSILVSSSSVVTSSSSSSLPSGITLVAWPFPARLDTLPVELVIPHIDGPDNRPAAERFDFLKDAQGLDDNLVVGKPLIVLRGRVLDGNGIPLAGVRVEIANQPEWGHTRSGIDGWYSLLAHAVSGLVVQYTKADYLSAQRKIPDPSLSDYQAMPDVALVPLSPVAWRVHLNQVQGVAPLAAEVVEDEDGIRQSVLLVPQGVSATLETSTGSTQLSTITVRQTEYTVGRLGELRMPATLPIASAYTYALDFSIDEAIQAGGGQVRFNVPVVNYTDNFLDFPVGTIVPVGSYNSDLMRWDAEIDGITLAIVGRNGDQALVDVDGDGQADNWNGRASLLGVTDRELRWLAGNYPVGKSLWRTLVSHFSPWDYNYPYVPEPDAEPPPDPKKTDASKDSVAGKDADPCESGSNIDVFGCTVSETWSIPGSSLSLVHASRNAKGFEPNRTLEIALQPRGRNVRPRSIYLQIEAAGQVHRDTVAGDQETYTWVWDGNDAFGRQVEGYIRAKVSLGYQWNLNYIASRAEFDQAWQSSSFGQPLLIGQSIGRSRGDGRISYSSTTMQLMYAGDYSPLGVPVWTLSGQETFFEAVYLRRDAAGNAVSLPITKVLGTRVAQSPTRLTQGFFYYDIEPKWVSGGLGDRVHYSYGSNLVDEFRSIGSNYRWDFRNVGANVDAHGLGMDGVDYYLLDGRLRRTANMIVGSGPTIGRNNTRFAIDRSGLVYWMDGTTLRVGNQSGNQPRIISGIPSDQTILDIAVQPDGTFWAATEQGIFASKQSTNAEMTSIVIAKPGERFTSMASDLQGRIFAGISSPSSSRIVAIPLGGGLVNVAGGGSTIISPNWISGKDVMFQGDLVVRANAAGQLTFMERLGTSNRAGWVDSIPMGTFQTPGVGILDTARQMVLVPDSLGRHGWTISAINGDTLYGFTYDDQGRTIAVREGKNGVLLLDWSNPHRIELTAPTGQQSFVELDADGFASRFVRDADGATFEATYSLGGLLTSWANPLGGVTGFTYGLDGRLAVDHNARGGFKQILRGSDPDTLGVGVVTASGHETWYERWMDTSGHWLRRTRQAYGNAEISKTSLDGKTDTVWTEDGDRMVRSAVSGTGQGQVTVSTNLHMLPNGEELTVRSASDVVYATKDSVPYLHWRGDTVTVGENSIVNTYDSESGMMITVSPMGRQSVRKLDANGRIEYQFGPGTDTVYYTYNNDGQVIASGPLARQTSFEYDAQRRISAIVDPLGRRTTYARDEVGRAIATTMPDGEIMSFGFNLADQLLQMELPLGSRHRFAYEPMGSDTSWQAPELAGAATFVETKSLDLDGRLLALRHPDGDSTTFHYDTGFRLNLRRSPTDTITWNYLIGTQRVASMVRLSSGATEEIRYTWNGSRLQAEESRGSAPGLVSTTYDGLWRVSALSVRDATGAVATVPFTYDRDGLTLSAGDLQLTRDPVSAKVTSVDIGLFSTSLLWQGSRMRRTEHRMGAASLRTWIYEMDALNRITRIGEGLRTTDFAYGIDGRLLQVRQNGTTVESYSWDAQGNRTAYTSTAMGSGTAEFDARDRLVRQGDANYSWDAKGAQSSRTTPQGTRHFVYDQRSNLLEAILEDGTSIEYRIDARDRRIGKTVNGVQVEGFLYKDQIDPIAWLHGDGSLRALFVYGERSHVPSYMNMQGERYRFISDHLGSVRMVVRASDGMVMQEIDYDAFGNELRNTNPGFQPFGFVGGITDTHTGLVRFGARDYDPETGRWTSVDPIRFDGGQGNLYVYVNGDPVNRVDVTGLNPNKIIGCLDQLSVCLTDPKTSHLDEECKTIQCTWNYEKCSRYNAAGLGCAVEKRKPEDFCDGNGAINPPPETSNSNNNFNDGKTTLDEFNRKKESHQDICIEKTGRGECAACFQSQGQSERVKECLGF